VRLCSLVLAVSLTVQSPAVDWQALPLDSYPPDARAQIAAARDAALRPSAADDAFGQLALVLHAWEQNDLAARAYEEAQRRQPTQVAWWALAGLLASRTGQHARAAEHYARAVELEETPLLQIRLADARLESGQLDDARRTYEAVVTKQGAEPAARYGLGRVAVAMGDATTARTHFERAVALEPTFGAAHYALSQLYRKAGDLDAARQAVARQQQCLACWPMPSDPFAARLGEVRDDAAALLQRGLQSAAQADDARAIALHEDAVTRDPRLLQARVNLITLYARTGNLAAAERHYQAVLAAGTQLAEAHHAFGLALVGARDLPRADAVLTLAVESNPLDADALHALGVIRETSRRLPEAADLYARAVAANPRARAVRFAHGRVLVNLGRLDDAIGVLLPLTTPDDAESARYVFALSAVYVRKGDLANGRRWGEEALARARKHGLADFAAAIERDLAKIRAVR
jgi:tetratricopeptide (TPR) repeat protein